MKHIDACSCIHYIAGVKIGPFAEHSNQLWNVSAVPTWSKVSATLSSFPLKDRLNAQNF
jgi:hypothetical protein